MEIVTQFSFKTYDVSKNVTYFQYHYAKAEQAQTLRAYQRWGVNASANVSASLYHDASGGNFMWGIYLGPKLNLRSTILKTFDNTPATPTSSTEIESDYITTVLINGEFHQFDPIDTLNLERYVYESRTFKSKSIFVKGSGGQSKGFKHISTLWAKDAGANIDWIERIWKTVRPFSSAEAYQNFINSEMPLSACYASNLDHLKAVKRKGTHRISSTFPKASLWTDHVL
ncbi:hypothetical protein R1flu_017565 [Riccia fluitans]|uniref:GIY-YIG homing endonuclease n=1 Tax=Riccia fluitans TaxID=41844 RepID=A0ABD1ZDI6_9MARC